MANNSRSEQPRIVSGSPMGPWFALAFCTSIALIAMVARFETFDKEGSVVKWALACICIALGLAGMALIACFAAPAKFTGTNVEGAMVCAGRQRRLSWI